MQLIKKSIKYSIIKSKSVFPFFVLIVMLIASCTVESKIAKEKVMKAKFRAVLIGPEFIHKVNLKSDCLTKEDSLRINNIDSLLYFQSDIIQFIDDSIFIEQCLLSMQNELITNYNVTLYHANSPFDKLPDSTFVLTFAEMEMEEFRYQDVEYYTNSQGNSYYVDMDVNAISLNAWFELKYKTPSDDLFPVLYTTLFHHDEMNDKIETVFKEQNSNDTVNETPILNTYKAAKLYGVKFASYFYDYMLNVQIYDLMPEGQKPNYYMHYDYKTGKIYPIYEEMFIELDE